MLRQSDEQAAWAAACEVVRGGGKVLWVSNTVGRAIATARRALGEGLPVEPFHSRYRYRDRLTRQQRVVDGFHAGQRGMLAVTTQVAEVSLDLSADLLISEWAPVPAMIQRLGRLNRYKDIPDEPKLALFLRPANEKPYHKENLQEAMSWLADVADGAARSQHDLAEAFLRATGSTAEEGLDVHVHCHWIDDPWRSEANKESLMEPGYTIEIVREEDLGERKLAELAIPMPFPRGRSWERCPLKGRYLVAPMGTVAYDPVWGAEYVRKELDPWII